MATPRGLLMLFRTISFLAVPALLLVGVATPTGCADDDPVAYSETISIALSGIKDGDIDNGTASEEKGITTESGNPYGEFIKTAQDRLGGADPSEVALISARIRLRSDSSDVGDIGDVFQSIELFFSTSDTTIPVGSVAAPTGTDIAVVLLDADLAALDDAFLTGSFKVGVRGPAETTLPNKFDLKLTLDLVFEARE